MLSDVEEINQLFFRYATGKFGTSSGENQIHDISMGDVQYIDGLPMKNHFNAYRSLNSEILLDIRIKISKTKIFIKTKTFQTQLRIQSK